MAIGLRHVPPAWDPRLPLDLTAPPNLLTGAKLGWMAQRPEACFAAFAASGIPVVRVPDRASDIGCELQDVVRLPGPLRLAPGVPPVTLPAGRGLGAVRAEHAAAGGGDGISAARWWGCATSGPMPAAT